MLEYGKRDGKGGVNRGMWGVNFGLCNSREDEGLLMSRISGGWCREGAGSGSQQSLRTNSCA